LKIITIIIIRFMSELSPYQWRTGPPGYLALARWAGWSGVLVGRHVKCRKIRLIALTGESRFGGERKE